MLYLGECVLFICVDFDLFMYVWCVDLCLGLVISLAYCHWGSLESLLVVALLMLDVSNI